MDETKCNYFLFARASIQNANTIIKNIRVDELPTIYQQRVSKLIKDMEGMQKDMYNSYS